MLSFKGDKTGKSVSSELYRILAIIVLSGIILYVGKPLLIPLSIAIFISFILQPFCSFLERKGVGRGLAIAIAILLITIIGAGAVFVLYIQILDFTNEWSYLRKELNELLVALKYSLTTDMGIPKEQVDGWVNDLVSSMATGFYNMAESALTSLFINLVMMVLIPVYAFLILYNRNQLVEVLFSLFPASNRNKISEIIKLSIKTYFNFISGMALVYLIVGILNSIGLFLLGVPHAIMFGFLTAVMTFIPYVGIVIASILPIVYAWITYDSIWYPLGVIGVFTLVQYLEANIIFPLAVSHKLHLSTLVTLMVIIIGGIIWGAAGMILFIPFTAILKLIADRMDGWEPLADFLGKKKPDVNSSLKK